MAIWTWKAQRRSRQASACASGGSALADSTSAGQQLRQLSSRDIVAFATQKLRELIVALDDNNLRFNLLGDADQYD
jgi:hypothetical protein